MNFVVTFLTNLYSKVLLLYPRRFRDEFASEMQDVFRDSLEVLAIIFTAVLGSNSYWLAHNGMHLSGARKMLALAGKISLIMLLPAWLELLRRAAGRLPTRFCQ